MVVRMRVLELMYYDNFVPRVFSFSIMAAADWKTRGPWDEVGVVTFIMTIPDSRVLLYCA